MFSMTCRKRNHGGEAKAQPHATPHFAARRQGGGRSTTGGILPQRRPRPRHCARQTLVAAQRLGGNLDRGQNCQLNQLFRFESESDESVLLNESLARLWGLRLLCCFGQSRIGCAILKDSCAKKVKRLIGN